MPASPKAKRLVLVIENKMLHFYLLDHDVYEQLPEAVFSWEETEEAARIIREKGTLCSIMHPDYTLNLDAFD